VRNVLAELHPLELNQLDALVSAVHSLLQRLARRSCSNHATAAGLQLPLSIKPRARVENVHAVLLGLLDSHGGALGVGARVSASGHDDGASVGVGDVELLRCQLAVAGGQHESREVRVQERKAGLRLWVAEAHVVLEDARAGRGDHEAGEQAAAEAQVLGRHAADGGLQDLLLDFGQNSSGGDRGGRVGAHAAGVGAGVAVADALVVLGGRQGEDGLAVGEGQDGDLVALEVLFDHDRVAGGAELVRDHDVLESGLGLLCGFREDDALAGCEAVGFDDDAVVDGVEVLAGGVVVDKVLVAGGGDVVALHEVL
jgi:hypothetical protein